MICRNFLLRFFVIFNFFAAGTVGREAIIGAEIAGHDDFPYQVSLQLDNSHICGGGIIGEEYILTAAQCIAGNKEHFFNRLSILTRTQNLYHHTDGAERVSVHKAFVLKEFHRRFNVPVADVAVLKLKRPLELSHRGSLQKLTLLKNRHDNHLHLSGKIAGFGWTWTHGTGIARTGNNTDGHLRFADADVVDCVTETIRENHICAKLRRHSHSEPAGVCGGDTGDLLITNKKTVIGILSVGPENCIEDTKPGIYTRVTHYLTFIRNAKEDFLTKNMLEYILSD